GRLFQRGNDRCAAARYEVRCRTHQLRRIRLDSAKISTGISMLDPDIAVLPPAEGFQSLPKRDDTRQHFGVVLGVSVQERDASHALALLRARRNWPCCCAAEQRDEVAALHSITSSARSRNASGI